MAAVTLADLPEDILILVAGHFETARDLQRLALSCRKLHQFVQNAGWRLFVRKSFPWLAISSTDGESCRKLAESLTWQSRCWDRRSLRFSALLPRHMVEVDEASGRNARRNRMGLFHTVLDVRDDVLGSGREVLAWGEGENVVVRWRNRRAGPVRMARMQGKDQGYEPGCDDVRALAILDVEEGSEAGATVLVGRQNGDLTVLSAAEDHGFGTVLGRLDTGVGDAPRRAISDFDLLGGRVAVATGSGVLTYNLEALRGNSCTSLEPSATWTLPTGGPDGGKADCSRAVWMAGGKALALGLHASSSPLCHLTVLPCGQIINDSAAKPSGNLDVKLCPFSLQVVAPAVTGRKDSTLLLSAWKDGTCRLQDMRTPSAFDMVYYQDNISPGEALERLLVFRNERFVGGGLSAPTLKVFDFRWTRAYHHTTALPCAAATPFPEPPQPFLNAPPRARAVLSAGVRARCDPAGSHRCHWHELSRDVYYRPNANLYLGNALPPHRGPYRTAGVWSLAKASDTASNFYAGVSGGVIEAELACAAPAKGDDDDAQGRDEVDPNFGFSVSDGVMDDDDTGYRSCRLSRYALMETGDGLAVRHNDRSIRLPPLMVWDDAPGYGAKDVHDRLDSRLSFSERDAYVQNPSRGWGRF